MRRLAMAVAGGIGMAVGLAPAAGATPEIVHFNDHGAVVVLEDEEVPCLGLTGDITLTINGHQHLFANDNKSGERIYFTGTWVAALDGGLTSAGRMTGANGGNFPTSELAGGRDKAEFTEISNGEITSGVGAGTKWNAVLHYTGGVDENGEPVVDGLWFERENCH